MAKRYDGDDQPDLFGSRAARDEAMKRVIRNAGKKWFALAQQHVISLPIGWRGTGEDMRLLAYRKGMLRPHHWNAWGPVSKWARLDGLFRQIGMTNMKTKRSHARMTPLYERVRPSHEEPQQPEPIPPLDQPAALGQPAAGQGIRQHDERPPLQQP